VWITCDRRLVGMYETGDNAKGIVDSLEFCTPWADSYSD
jgi:hypothetical protein